MICLKSHWMIILAAPTPNLSWKLASVLSTEWSVYSALIQGGEAAGLREEKEPRTFFLCWNAACHLTSVEQSFLIKTEGLDGRVLHFTLGSLNPRRHWGSVPVGSTVWDRRFPLFHSSLSTLFHERTKPRKITVNHWEKPDFGRASVCRSQTMPFNRYSWCYWRRCPKLAPKV